MAPITACNASSHAAATALTGAHRYIERVHGEGCGGAEGMLWSFTLCVEFYTALPMLLCRMLHAACCLLRVAHCMLHAARCMLHSAYFMLHDAFCMLAAACCMLHVKV